jgi:hypothetical protein
MLGFTTADSPHQSRRPTRACGGLLRGMVRTTRMRIKQNATALTLNGQQRASCFDEVQWHRSHIWSRRATCWTINPHNRSVLPPCIVMQRARAMQRQANSLVAFNGSRSRSNCARSDNSRHTNRPASVSRSGMRRASDRDRSLPCVGPAGPAPARRCPHPSTLCTPGRGVQGFAFVAGVV